MTDEDLAAIEANLTPRAPRKFLDSADHDAERVVEADAEIVRLLEEVRRLRAELAASQAMYRDLQCSRNDPAL